MGQLADILVKVGGYNMADALNAEQGPRADELAREFGLTGGAGTPGAPGGGAEDYTNQLFELLTGQTRKTLEGFDEPSARLASEEQWGGYYDELLKDYLGQVTTGEERSIADLASGLKLVKERRDEFRGDIDRQSPLTQERIGGQAADRGLYFSGGREETQRRQLEGEERQKGSYDREYESKVQQAELEQKRYLEDVERQKKERERTLAREREQAVTGGIETRREEKFLGYS